MSEIIRSMVLAAGENAQNLRGLGADGEAGMIVDQTISIMEMLSVLALVVDEESPETKARIEAKWQELFKQYMNPMSPEGLIC
jgi:hypothetical protein